MRHLENRLDPRISLSLLLSLPQVSPPCSGWYQLVTCGALGQLSPLTLIWNLSSSTEIGNDTWRKGLLQRQLRSQEGVSPVGSDPSSPPSCNKALSEVSPVPPFTCPPPSSTLLQSLSSLPEALSLILVMTNPRGQMGPCSCGMCLCCLIRWHIFSQGYWPHSTFLRISFSPFDLKAPVLSYFSTVTLIVTLSSHNKYWVDWHVEEAGSWKQLKFSFLLLFSFSFI